jgi:hypothetical protein
LITALARLDAYPVGVMVNGPYVIGGSLDAPAFDNLVKFVDTCVTFHLPIANFVDQPGFHIGREGRDDGNDSPRHARALRGLSGRETVGRHHGAGRVRRCRRGSRQDHRPQFPLCLAMGFAAGRGWHRSGLQARPRANAVDPEKLRHGWEDRFNAIRSPLRTVEMFGVEEIVDPPAHC